MLKIRCGSGSCENGLRERAGGKRVNGKRCARYTGFFAKKKNSDPNPTIAASTVNPAR